MSDEREVSAAAVLSCAVFHLADVELRLNTLYREYYQTRYVTYKTLRLALNGLRFLCCMRPSPIESQIEYLSRRNPIPGPRAIEYHMHCAKINAHARALAKLRDRAMAIMDSTPPDADGTMTLSERDYACLGTEYLVLFMGVKNAVRNSVLDGMLVWKNTE